MNGFVVHKFDVTNHVFMQVRILEYLGMRIDYPIIEKVTISK